MKIKTFKTFTITFFIFLFGFYACSQDSYLDTELTTEKRVELLLNEMTLEEKIGQMCQYVGEVSSNANGNEDEKVNYILGLNERVELIKKGEIGSFLKVSTYKEANYLQELASQSRLKIPLLIATDAIHGHGMYNGATTIYPTEIGIASSFDTTLAFNIAKYTAREMRATGYHWSFSPNIEISRDPRWGRNGECFGEDPYLVTKMGCAMINGYQGNGFKQKENVLACAKHFVAGGIPYNGLNGAPADISERTLYECFFPPFKAAIENNVFTIMPAHNEINGIPCHAHKTYLTDLIRNEWGFKGFYISDWMDIERLYTTHKVVDSESKAFDLSVNAGLDMHMHGPNFLENVKKSVVEGRIDESRINDAVRKIIYAKFQLGLFENRYIDSAQVSKVLLNKEHLDLALLSARESIVLLKNKNHLLPLSKKVNSIFITGPSASNSQSILGDWARIQPEENVTTVLEGIGLLTSPKTKINYLECTRFDTINTEILVKATKMSQLSDLAIVVIGENSSRFQTSKTSGENLDRMTLEPPGNQLELVKAIKKSGKPIVVVLINGGPIASEWLSENADVIIEAWEPGMYGGQAIAEVIFGDYNPGGRLPITIPRSVGHIQSFYNHKPSAFHRGYLFQSEREPLFEFGYGLSFTEFKYDNLEIKQKHNINEDVSIKFTIENTGEYDGDEVVLIYMNDLFSSVTTPVKKLIHFDRIHLKQNEKKEITIVVPVEKFGFFNEDMNYVIEPGDFEILIGNKLLSSKITIE